MNAWLKMRLLPGWKPLTDLVFVLTCSTHSRLLLCGQSQSLSCSPPLTFKLSNALPSPSTASCLEDTSPLYFFYFIQPSIVLHSLSECCFLCLPESLNLNLSSSIVVHLHLFYNVPFLSMACSVNVMIILNSSAFCCVLLVLLINTTWGCFCPGLSWGAASCKQQLPVLPL